ncbi:hypothetical protein EIP91_007780 [Steccherinum ochraceum]|uniref:Zn(2)-C6 fungal-type domain-containing protein n=1 Tax=Steccherinum ochraceum TaxID=92696 RepID=A0A4R0RE25_9APHY|nr:hypothetical protein EIP91_007780 [Steccherinum ochraceum]
MATVTRSIAGFRWPMVLIPKLGCDLCQESKVHCEIPDVGHACRRCAELPHQCSMEWTREPFETLPLPTVALFVTWMRHLFEYNGSVLTQRELAYGRQSPAVARGEKIPGDDILEVLNLHQSALARAPADIHLEIALTMLGQSEGVRTLRLFTETCRVIALTCRPLYHRSTHFRVDYGGPLPLKRFDAYMHREEPFLSLATHLQSLTVTCVGLLNRQTFPARPTGRMHDTINVIEFHAVLDGLPALRDLCIEGHHFTGDPSRFLAKRRIRVSSLTLTDVGFWTHVAGKAAPRTGDQTMWFTSPHSAYYDTVDRIGIPNVFAYFLSYFEAAEYLRIANMRIVPFADDYVHQAPYASPPDALPTLDVKHVQLPGYCVPTGALRLHTCILTFPEIVSLLNQSVTIQGVREIVKPLNEKFSPSWQTSDVRTVTDKTLVQVMRHWMLGISL